MVFSLSAFIWWAVTTTNIITVQYVTLYSEYLAGNKNTAT